jgi:GDP-4-dehydro-6-deoxy-D-mannose reductase
VAGTRKAVRGAQDEECVPSETGLFPVDLLVASDVERLIGDVQPEVVCHLAAESSVARSMADPMGALIHNATMQFNVLEAVVQFVPTARVLVVGSSDEYGNVHPDENPVGEAAPFRPASPYALSKVMQDMMGLQYVEAQKLDIIRVRPFLQLGPRRSTVFAVGSFARQVAEIERGMRPPVLHTGSIDLLRDFTDVRDVARASALAVRSGSTGAVYNIATGCGHTLRELIDIMLRKAGVTAEVRVDEKLLRPGEAAVVLGDARALRAATGWEPTISFERSVEDTLEYWRERVSSGTLKEEDTL